MDKQIAHNIPIWKLIFTLQTMMDENFQYVDITVEDDLTLSLRGVKQPPEDIKDVDINQLII